MLALALTAASLVWTGLLVSAPLLPATLAAPLYGIGSLICHQIPERSFHLAGAQLPVCARCIGIYGGVAASAIALAVRRPVDTRALLIAGLIPVAASVALEWAGLWYPSNIARAVTGVILGSAAGVAVALAAARDRMNAQSPAG